MVDAELAQRPEAREVGELLITHRRLVASSKTMWVYSCAWDQAMSLPEETQITVRVKGSSTATEGRVVGFDKGRLLLGVRNNLGAIARPVYVQPDVKGFFHAITTRLQTIATNVDSLSDRPVTHLFSTDPDHSEDRSVPGVSLIEMPDDHSRHEYVTEMVLVGLRQRKRVLLTSARNIDLDESLIRIVRAMRMEGLSYSTLVTRYPALVLEGKGSTDLRQLAFEQQLRTNVGQRQAEQTTMRSAYHRYQKIAPSVANAQEKRQDLDEVEHLESRILREIDKLDCKGSDLGIQVDTYESIPLWQRLSMQVGGKNPSTMVAMRSEYTELIDELREQLADLQPRLSKAKQAAYLPTETWREYEEIKEIFEARGGLESVRTLISTDQGPSDHAFQEHFLIATTTGCVASDDLFNDLPFDTVIVDGIENTPLPQLLPVACLAQQRIIFVGNDTPVASTELTTKDTCHPLGRILALKTAMLQQHHTQAAAS